MAYLNQNLSHYGNDGLMQRFQLMVYPDEPPVWQLVDKAPNLQARQRAVNIIKTLSEMDFTQHGATQGEHDKIPYIRFSDAAQEVFFDWLRELEPKLRAEEYPIMQEHLAKYRKLMPALALIFHLIEVADPQIAKGEKIECGVSVRAAEMAAEWCDYLESHARRIYGLARNSQHAATLLSQKIAQSKLNSSFTVRDILHKDWHSLNNREVIEKACRELVESGWIRETTRGGNGKGRPTIDYIINPKILQKSQKIEQGQQEGSKSISSILGDENALDMNRQNLRK